MPRSIPVATLRGTVIRFHWTFVLFISAALVAALLTSGPAASGTLLALITAMFLCIILHEFGHITAARLFGIPTPEIMLLPIGGLAKLRRIPLEPKEELAIAVAGPLVSFVLFAGLILILGRQPDWEAIPTFNQDQFNLVEQLAVFNLAVGLFNLIPAFPMDGGRILRAMLAVNLPRPRATWIAARIGQAIAILIAGLGLFAGNPILAVIGVFIFFAAQSEARIDAMRNAIGGVSIGQVMVADRPRLKVSDPLLNAADLILHSDYEEIPVIEMDGALAGFLLRTDLDDAIVQFGPASTVRQAMQKDVPKMAVQSQADKAADMIEAGASAVGVIDRNGHFEGLVTKSTLLDALGVNSAMWPDHDALSHKPFEEQLKA
ncbi:site-2 protease family protein [Pontixanthobacter gangjinensis]|uniref:Zinc metalloprotease n=1 Tax=Pontixanthobacter gangjinensis TaxID=1028742 RepID=A0A6I4SP95_9SPHN|nr:site-2 protease family protein [Pontixanthobacter gangjinensis]MXO57645.1 CBS domain-containing protein [Pontixanthobacter gangjinensis]